MREESTELCIQFTRMPTLSLSAAHAQEHLMFKDMAADPYLKTAGISDVRRGR